jgi:hypothetical protein
LGYYWIDLPIADRRVTWLAYGNDWFSIAMPHAADLNYGAVKPVLFKLAFYCPEHFHSPGCLTAGGGTHHDYRFITPKLPPLGLGTALYFLES